MSYCHPRNLHKIVIPVRFPVTCLVLCTVHKKIRSQETPQSWPLGDPHRERRGVGEGRLSVFSGQQSWFSRPEEAWFPPLAPNTAPSTAEDSLPHDANASVFQIWSLTLTQDRSVAFVRGERPTEG